ncbi:MAG: hypothetical protein ACKVP4_02180 [Hyphomicrobium sp.]
MLEHAQRAAGHGAKMTAYVAVLAALVVAAWEAHATTGLWSTFGEIAVPRVAIAVFGGAAFGALVFGFIGFCAALLGVKRVGWTFTYALFGAAQFVFAAHVMRNSIAASATMFAGPAGFGAAITLAALTGAVAGALVARGLKAGPEA